MQSRAGFDAAERRQLQQDLRAGNTLLCPRCAVSLTLRDVPQPPGVPYVRHRVLALCPACHAAAPLDRA